MNTMDNGVASDPVSLPAAGDPPVRAKRRPPVEQRALRLLVVRPRSTGSQSAGDNVVHSKMVDHLSAAMDVRVVELETVVGATRLLNLVRCGPPEVARHMSRRNAPLLLDAVHEFSPDVICLGHEYTFPLLSIAKSTGAGVVLYAHNVHSQIYDSDKRLMRLVFAGAIQNFERRFYGDPDVELVCISESDRRCLRERGVRQDSIVAPPGAPPEIALRPGARPEAALVITGSYQWWRKGRDLRRFAAEPVDPLVPVPCFVSDDAASCASIVGSRSASNLDWAGAIRVGVLTDRFVGGFKLKSTEYVARNCAVVSFADIFEEFSGIPHAAEFVRIVGSRAEAEDVAKELAARDDDVVDRFLEFKAACLSHFDWSRALKRLEATIELGAGRVHSSQSSQPS
jgi:Glycosyltransferase Family 4